MSINNDTTGSYTGSYNVSDIDFEELPDNTVVGGDWKNRLEWLMFCIGQYGFPTFVKFDPFREDNNFTVMVGKYPRKDTNDPIEYLSEILRKKRDSESEE